jgi:hypothetical protein
LKKWQNILLLILDKKNTAERCVYYTPNGGGQIFWVGRYIYQSRPIMVLEDRIAPSVYANFILFKAYLSQKARGDHVFS